MSISETTHRGSRAALMSLRGQVPGVPSRPWAPHKPTLADGPARRLDVAAKAAAVDSAPLGLSIKQQQQQQGTGNAASSGAPQPPTPPEFGYAAGWDSKYRVISELGRGGNGVVTLVMDLQTGQEYATKSIPKVLTDPNLSDRCGRLEQREGGRGRQRASRAQAGGVTSRPDGCARRRQRR